MTKDIFLFGDSYMDETPKYEFSWMQLLRNKFEPKHKIKNYARSGAGPHRNFPIIVDLIQWKKIVPGDVIICHVSGTTRVDFPGIDGEVFDAILWNPSTKKSYTHVLPTERLTAKHKSLSEARQSEKRHKTHLGFTPKQIETVNYYKNFKNEIDFSFLTFDQLLMVSGLAMVSYLYAISQALKIKVFIFDGDSSFHDPIFRSLNNEYFHYSKYNLFRVSTAEIFYDEVDTVVDKLKSDLRYNHLSDENQKIFYEYVFMFIRGWKLSTNIPRFKENFRHADDIYIMTDKKNPGKEGNQFIYE